MLSLGRTTVTNNPSVETTEAATSIAIGATAAIMDKAAATMDVTEDVRGAAIARRSDTAIPIAVMPLLVLTAVLLAILSPSAPRKDLPTKISVNRIPCLCSK